MTDQDLRARVAEVIGRSLETSQEALLADTPFFELGWDSLDVVETGIIVEREFGVDFEGEVNAKDLPRNLSDVVRLLEVHLSRAQGAVAGGRA
jgi:acyl carrier protein